MDGHRVQKLSLAMMEDILASEWMLEPVLDMLHSTMDLLKLQLRFLLQLLLPFLPLLNLLLLPLRQYFLPHLDLLLALEIRY